jgi:hypothetical protein
MLAVRPPLAERQSAYLPNARCWISNARESSVLLTNVRITSAFQTSGIAEPETPEASSAPVTALVITLVKDSLCSTNIVFSFLNPMLYFRDLTDVTANLYARQDHESRSQSAHSR